MQPENPDSYSASARAAWPATAIPGQPGAHLRPAQADGATADAYDGPADGSSEADPARGLETIPDAEPTPGSELLDELRSQIAQFVIPPSSEALDAITLWVAATQLQPAWQHAPRLAVVGPAKRCGKSRLLDVLTETVHEPMLTINTTPAAIFRSINEEEPPTLLVDEADTIFGPKVAEKNEETRGLLNAGHQRGRYVTRVVGNDHTPYKFATFAMAAIAGIGDLPDTVMDRSVVIRMRRRAEGEKVKPFRSRRDIPALHELRDRIRAWALPLLEDAASLEPWPTGRSVRATRATSSWTPGGATARPSTRSTPVAAKTDPHLPGCRTCRPCRDRAGQGTHQQDGSRGQDGNERA